MDYGLNIAASGALTAMYRQDVYANNLANMDTVGFKPDIPVLKQRLDARHEDHLNLPSNVLLERLGAGVLLAPNRVNYTQGAPRSTSNQLDLAISGDGYFVIQDQSTGSGDRVRLTRDGRFMRNSEGTLVNQRGQSVLDIRNRPITVPSSTDIKVDGTGAISVAGERVAQIQVISVPDNTGLVKEGEGAFIANSDLIGNARPATGTVSQNTIEESSVDEIRTLMDITGASRDADANFSMIQQLDRMNDRAINSFGRVA